jgi:hypothetical protein
MRSAVDPDRASRGRAGVVEAEEGDDSVDVHEQHGSLILHLDGAR